VKVFRADWVLATVGMAMMGLSLMLPDDKGRTIFAMGAGLYMKVWLYCLVAISKDVVGLFNKVRK
jgi:hypothetical protein